MNRRTIGGRYELDPRSGRSGGMGEVVFGYDTRLDRPVAVKFLQRVAADENQRRVLVQRFVRESRITARLEHPGVPAVYDCGTQDGEHYLVMQLVEGHSLSAVLAGTGALPVAWAAAVAAQVCSVLAAAHAHSLVHRDLKPGNLMLCPDGTVKVLDFGIAAARAGYDPALTHAGAIMGTPNYMAPEQAERGLTSPRSDLYAVGVLLDEMLTGRNQFLAGTALATMRNQVQLVPRSPRELRPDTPPELDRLVLDLLGKDPEERPGSAVEVYDRLVGHCREVPPLLPYVDSEAEHPFRRYAAVLGGAPPASRPRGEQSLPRPPATRDVTEDDVARARELREAGRYGQAADLLFGVVSRLQGSEAVPALIELADLRFLAGDYLAAALDFRNLVADLTRTAGEADPRVLRCRYMEAKCHAQLGNDAHALDLLRSLLELERRYGLADKQLRQVNRLIAQLELGVNMGLRPYIR